MSSTDSALKLKPIQLAALVILMAEAREVTNGEFTDLARFTLTGADRIGLEALGLIESRKVGRELAFQLTDKGWLFCKQLHTADVNVGRSVAARSVFVLLDGLRRSLDRLRVSHGEFFKQPGEAVPATAVPATAVPATAVPAVPATAATPTGDGDVEATIRQAYADLPKAADGWVGLADLRERLGDLDRSTVDETLRVMARQQGVRIIPVANSKALRPRDRAAALRIGGEDNHALWIGPA
jgi:hypothetical protein